jgi:hypothetical protein
MAGVQFQVNGVNLGLEATSAPYQTSWNTSKFSNGSHSLTAVARDSVGNLAGVYCGLGRQISKSFFL